MKLRCGKSFLVLFFSVFLSISLIGFSGAGDWRDWLEVNPTCEECEKHLSDNEIIDCVHSPATSYKDGPYWCEWMFEDGTTGYYGGEDNGPSNGAGFECTAVRLWDGGAFGFQFMGSASAGWIDLTHHVYKNSAGCGREAGEYGDTACCFGECYNPQTERCCGGVTKAYKPGPNDRRRPYLTGVKADICPVRERYSCEDTDSDGFTECVAEDYWTCQAACEKFAPLNIRAMIEQGILNPDTDIFGECTDRDINDQDAVKDKTEQRGYIEQIKKEKNIANINMDHVFNPEDDGADYFDAYGEKKLHTNIDLNGEKYCQDVDGSAFNFAVVDCLCYVDKPCIDEDGDGWGAEGTYAGNCPKGGGDCWDTEPPFSEINPQLDRSNEYYIDIIKDKRAQIDRNGDGKIADDINPGKVESSNANGKTENVVYGSWFETAAVFPDERLDISICTDGLDNDCNGAIDCNDAKCVVEDSRNRGISLTRYSEDSLTYSIYEAQCLGTCSDACLQKYDNVKEGHCVEKDEVFSQNPVTKYRDVNHEYIRSTLKLRPEESHILMDPIQDKNNLKDCQFHGSPSNEYRGGICVCVLESNCEDACKNKASQLSDEAGNEYIPASKDPYSEASYEDNQHQKALGSSGSDNCFIKNTDEVKNPYDFYTTSGDGTGCCCNLCEKTNNPTKGFTWEEVKAGIGFAIDYVLHGGDIKATIDTVKQRELSNLFNSIKENPYSRPQKELVSDIVNRFLDNTLCKEVVDKVLESDRMKDQLHSLATLAAMSHEGIVDVGENIIAREDISLAGYEITSIPPKDSPPITYPAPTLNSDYKGEYGEGEEYRAFYDHAFPEALRAIFDLANLAIHHPGGDCKICPSSETITKQGFSYITYSDLIEGKVSDKGLIGTTGVVYSAEPHGITFLKPFKLEYSGNGFPSVFSQEEFENGDCLLEAISETTTFVITTNQTNFTYENLTFNFPEYSVSNDTEVTITKKSFDCALNVFLRYEDFVGEPTLFELLYSAEKVVEEEKGLSFFDRFFKKWLGLY
jgi:hypothetical protein